MGQVYSLLKWGELSSKVGKLSSKVGQIVFQNGAKAKFGSHYTYSVMDEDLLGFSLTSLLRLYQLGHVLADFGLGHTTLDLKYIYSTGL